DDDNARGRRPGDCGVRAVRPARRLAVRPRDPDPCGGRPGDGPLDAPDDRPLARDRDLRRHEGPRTERRRLRGVRGGPALEPYIATLDRRMIEKLVEQIEARFAELTAQMSDPEVVGDRNRFAEVGREYRRLEGPNALAVEW